MLTAHVTRRLMSEPLPTILITGGAGFIGAHVTRAVLADQRYAQDRVLVLDDLSGGFRDNVPDDPRCQFLAGSITDDALIDRVFAEHRIRIVFHLAAYAAEGLSHFIRRFYYENLRAHSATFLDG